MLDEIFDKGSDIRFYMLVENTYTLDSNGYFLWRSSHRGLTLKDSKMEEGWKIISLNIYPGMWYFNWFFLLKCGLLLVRPILMQNCVFLL